MEQLRNRKKEEVFCNRMSGVTDVSDSGGGERKGRDQRTKTQCARTGDRGGGGQRGRRVKGERGQGKQRRGQRHAQPTQRMLIQASNVQPNLHLLRRSLHAQGKRAHTSLLTVQNFMKYCSTVAAMNKQYTSE